VVLPAGLKAADDEESTVAVVTAPHVVAEKVEEVAEGEEKPEGEEKAAESKEEPAE
jgi:hypothetical protein